MAEIRGAEYDSVSSRLSSFCTTIAPDFCCLVSGINHTEDNPSGIPSTQAYSRKICFLFERRIRWRRAFFNSAAGRLKVGRDWEAEDEEKERDLIVRSSIAISSFRLDLRLLCCRSIGNENREWWWKKKKKSKKRGKTVKCFANWFREQT